MLAWPKSSDLRIPQTPSTISLWAWPKVVMHPFKHVGAIQYWVGTAPTQYHSELVQWNFSNWRNLPHHFFSLQFSGYLWIQPSCWLIILICNQMISLLTHYSVHHHHSISTDIEHEFFSSFEIWCLFRHVHLIVWATLLALDQVSLNHSLVMH